MVPTEQRSFVPLTHPVFLVALVALIGNDTVGKARWPGLVTGKLSDVVGPIVLGTLVGVALRGRWPRAASLFALIVPAALMVLIKTSAPGAAAVVAVLDAVTPWSHAIVADPTDLLGLVGLAVVPRILAAGAPPVVVSSSPTVAAPGSRPSPLRWIVLGVGVWACAATSMEEPTVHDRVGVTEQGIVAIDSEYGGPVLAAPDPNGPWDIESAPADDQLLAVSRSNQICLERSPGVCVRSGPALRIDESSDGGATWLTVWQLDPDESWIGQTRADAAQLGPDQLAAGEALELDDGRVVVAMGVFEPVTRGVDGVWGPEPSGFRDIPAGAWFFLPLMTLGLVMSLALVWPSSTHVRTRVLGSVGAVLGGPSLLGALYAWLASPYDGFTLFVFFWFALGAAGLQTIVVLVGWGFRFADADRRALVALGFVAGVLGGVAVALLTVVPLRTWQAGSIGWDLTRYLVFALALLGSAVASVMVAVMIRSAVDPVEELAS